MSHIYISYHPQDVDRLFVVHEALRKQNVADEFLTYTGDQPQFTETNRQAISKASAVVCLVSAASLNSQTLLAEAQFAAEVGVPIFTAILDPLKLTSNWAALFRRSKDYHLSHETMPDLSALIHDLRSVYETECPVVSVMNLKGGVGKTTVSSQVFGALQAERRNRVLLIDFDPQFNLTQFFLSRDESDRRTAGDQSVLSLFEPGLLTSTVHPSPALDWAHFNDAIFTVPKIEDVVRPLISPDRFEGALDLICGQFELTKFAFLDNADALTLAEQNLRRCIDRYRRDYDLIVIDTNPSASFLTRVTLEVTDQILAPILPNEYALRGLRLLDMILRRFSPGDARPDVSVIFNGVPKSQQNRFEEDARDAVYDREVGFNLSKALLTNTLYQSSFLGLKTPPDGVDPASRLAVRSARGAFSADLKRRLSEIAMELESRLSERNPS